MFLLEIHLIFFAFSQNCVSSKVENLYVNIYENEIYKVSHDLAIESCYMYSTNWTKKTILYKTYTGSKKCSNTCRL